MANQQMNHPYICIGTEVNHSRLLPAKQGHRRPQITWVDGGCMCEVGAHLHATLCFAPVQSRMILFAALFTNRCEIAPRCLMSVSSSRDTGAPTAEAMTMTIDDQLQRAPSSDFVAFDPTAVIEVGNAG